MIAAKHKGRENTHIFKISKGAAWYGVSKPKMGESDIYARKGGSPRQAARDQLA